MEKNKSKLLIFGTILKNILYVIFVRYSLQTVWKLDNFTATQNFREFGNFISSRTAIFVFLEDSEWLKWSMWQFLKPQNCQIRFHEKIEWQKNLLISTLSLSNLSFREINDSTIQKRLLFTKKCAYLACYKSTEKWHRLMTGLVLKEGFFSS